MLGCSLSRWSSSPSGVLGLGCPVAVFVFPSCVALVDDLAEHLDSTPARVLEAVVSHLRKGGCSGLRFGVADTSLGVVVQALSRLCCLLCSGRRASRVFSFCFRQCCCDQGFGDRPRLAGGSRLEFGGCGGS